MKDQKRINGEKVHLDSQRMLNFFETRSKVSSETNPYISVTYQDKAPEISLARDQSEKELIIPKLQLNGNNRILDIGCGVGRWAQDLLGNVGHYVGVDFSGSLVAQAQKKYQTLDDKIEFHVFAAQDVSVKTLSYPSYFDRVIISGVLLYMNDEDIICCFQNLKKLLTSTALIYIREPLSLEQRLTLNGFWSKDMEQEYYAIYRTKEQVRELICTGLDINIDFLFEPLYSNAELNNRKETMQFYSIFEVCQ